GGAEILVWSFDAPANEVETAYTGVINAPSIGSYRVKFVFEASGNTNGKNNYVDLVGINAILASTSENCAAGIEFTVTGPTQGYYPVGTTTVTYTATLTNAAGVITSETCSFDIVVNPLEVVANDDVFTKKENPGIAGNVLANDEVFCSQATLDNGTLTVVTPSDHEGVVLDTTTGNVVCGNAVPNGTYTIVYRLCAEGTNICDEATVTVTVEDGPLPVTGLNLLASRSGSNVNLNWVTQSEQNSSYFLVERSVDGVNFRAITTERLNAAGNSNSQRNYGIIDPNRIEPVIYYRVRMVGIDGTSRLSNIVSVRMSSGREFRVYPNPVYNMFTIEFGENGRYQVDLISANGQRIMVRSDIQISNSFSSITLPRNNVPGGLYELRVTNMETGRVSLSKVVFQPR
ncbi:MAG TPA: T9SS type A sorting domain-containing protein, partial [Phnomibacter sp.]|nr:T9SS type A sorting domain-containing protein [Phnomibacter sp.]